MKASAADDEQVDLVGQVGERLDGTPRIDDGVGEKRLICVEVDALAPRRGHDDVLRRKRSASASATAAAASDCGEPSTPVRMLSGKSPNRGFRANSTEQGALVQELRWRRRRRSSRPPGCARAARRRRVSPSCCWISSSSAGTGSARRGAPWRRDAPRRSRDGARRWPPRRALPRDVTHRPTGVDGGVHVGDGREPQHSIRRAEACCRAASAGVPSKQGSIESSFWCPVIRSSQTMRSGRPRARSSSSRALKNQVSRP